jgi:methylglutaconyl-CoA hydratase
VSELLVVQDGPVRRITLNRPDRRNALSRSLMSALGDAFADVGEGGETRVVVLAGEGPAFCAGGDIGEFVASAREGNAASDATHLAATLETIATCPVPVIARVQGAAFGGGVGMVCVADIAIAAEGSRFSLSEARLGLVPAVISPYVLASLGPRAATAQMLLAALFGVDDALRMGLIHRVVAADELDSAVETAIADLLKGAPGALATIKRLPAMLAGADAATARAVTTMMLTERLASDEAQEGLRAFLEKRSPAWVPPVDETESR